MAPSEFQPNENSVVKLEHNVIRY